MYHSFSSINTNQFFGTLALKSNSTVWMWGNNNQGQIGDNTKTQRSSPVSVVGDHSFTSLSGGYIHSAGLKSDGTCWCWGDGSTAGQLGDKTATDKSSPVSVVGAHAFTIVSSGGYHTVAIKSGNTCWSWGYNGYGQLGDRSATARSSPISVVGAHAFTGVAAGYYHSLGLKSGGTVWAWGNNNGDYITGRLGDGTVNNRSSPVSVIGAHAFASVRAGYYNSVGLKSDNGTVWAWGNNDYGQIGDGTVTSRSSPVSVVGAHSFTQISTAGLHMIGLKSDNGTVWAWGDNTHGQLGDGTVDLRSSPVSVIGAHSFTAVGTGLYYSFGLKANGEIWSFGSSSFGQIGDNTITSRSSPVAVISWLEPRVPRMGFVNFQNPGIV